MPTAEYYLQVANSGESPTWPLPEEELLIGKQELDPNFMQYWAYPKESGREAEDQPHAEVVAGEYPTTDPVVLIDQLHPKEGGVKDYLELIVAKNGHAWAKTESSPENLEDNLSSVLEYAKSKYDLKIVHFMTTKRVSDEIEQQLDKLEKNSDQNLPTMETKEELTEDGPEVVRMTPLGTGTPVKAGQPMGLSPPIGAGSAGGSSSSKALAIALTLSVVGIFAGGAFIFRDRIVAKLNRSEVVTPTPTLIPTPSPTPTPTPVSADRSRFKVRVLNGTTKTGAAAALSEKLKSLGWVTSGMGNAKDQQLAQTLVRVRSATDSAAVVMAADLAPDLKASISADLKPSDKVDLEVVIGRD